ncbi:hypothetical protein F4803DRAFT_157491 [Xylaria telfairii]|nr:hypothetical protein F4803DRAFT_157491 [Xylaria telfairii]
MGAWGRLKLYRKRLNERHHNLNSIVAIPQLDNSLNEILVSGWAGDMVRDRTSITLTLPRCCISISRRGQTRQCLCIATAREDPLIWRVCQGSPVGDAIGAGALGRRVAVYAEVARTKSEWHAEGRVGNQTASDLRSEKGGVERRGGLDRSPGLPRRSEPWRKSGVAPRLQSSGHSIYGESIYTYCFISSRQATISRGKLEVSLCVNMHRGELAQAASETVGEPHMRERKIGNGWQKTLECVKRRKAIKAHLFVCPRIRKLRCWFVFPRVASGLLSIWRRLRRSDSEHRSHRRPFYSINCSTRRVVVYHRTENRDIS